MCIRDYSQLPVMQGERDVKGIISWKSIGAAHAQGANPTYVRDCMDDPQVVDGKVPLADAAEVIYKHDYVLVRGEQGKITGILTAVDLAREFKERTYPFLLIGEIEHHIRNLILGRFTPEEFVAAASGDERVRGPINSPWAVTHVYWAPKKGGRNWASVSTVQCCSNSLIECAKSETTSCTSRRSHLMNRIPANWSAWLASAARSGPEPRPRNLLRKALPVSYGEPVKVRRASRRC